MKVLTSLLTILINCILSKIDKDKIITQSGENIKFYFIVRIQLTEISVGRTICQNMIT